MLLKVDCLLNAVGKQPSIFLIDLGRKWMLGCWWWWWWSVSNVFWTERHYLGDGDGPSALDVSIEYFKKLIDPMANSLTSRVFLDIDSKVRRSIFICAGIRFLEFGNETQNDNYYLFCSMLLLCMLTNRWVILKQTSSDSLRGLLILNKCFTYLHTG